MTEITDIQMPPFETEPQAPEFPCTKCDRVFGSKNALQGHMIAHRPAINCPECGKPYKSPGALGNHRKHEHGVSSANGHKDKQPSKAAQRVNELEDLDAGDVLGSILDVLRPGGNFTMNVDNVRFIAEWYTSTNDLIDLLRG